MSHLQLKTIGVLFGLAGFFSLHENALALLGIGDVIVLLRYLLAHEYASHVNWIHCFAFQVPNCTQLVTFFVQTHAPSLPFTKPHSHEPQCDPDQYGLSFDIKTLVLCDGTQGMGSYTIRSIKMRETSEFFLFVYVLAFSVEFVCLKVLSKQRDGTVGI